MAKKITTKVPSPGPSQTAAAVHYQQQKAENEDSEGAISKLREEIMTFGTDKEKPRKDPVPDDLTTGEPEGDISTATPVGGKQKKADSSKLPEVAVITPPPVKEGELETDEQLNARLDKFKPRNSSEEQGFGPLKAVVTEKHQLARTLAAEKKALADRVKELETKIVPDEELSRLRGFEHIVSVREVESLPKWQEYDKKIEAASASAATLLKGFSLPELSPENLDKILAAVDKRGGLVKFSSSEKPAGSGKQYQNPDGSTMTEAQWFQKWIYSKMDRRQQNQFDMLTAEADKLSREKETALDEARANAGETLKSETKKFWDEFNTEANATIAELIPTLKEFDWPTSMPVVAITDTPEEKKEKEEQIKAWQKADQEVVKYTGAITAKERATNAWWRAISPFIIKKYNEMKASLADVTKERDTYKEKWDGIKDSRKLGRSASIVPMEPKPAEIGVSTEEALAKAGFK